MNSYSIRDVWSATVLAGIFALGLARGQDQPPAGTWESTLTLGANVTRGNSETLLLNGSLAAQRKVDDHEVRLGAQANYGETQTTAADGSKDTQKNVQNSRAFAEYKRLLGTRTYGYINTELSEDDIAGLDYRFMIGPGLGYYAIKTESQNLGLELGLTYIREKEDAETDDQLALRLAERYEAKLSATAKAWQFAEYLPETSDLHNYLLNAEAGVEAAVNTSVNLRLVLQDKYDSQPAQGKERNDLLLIAGLRWRL